MTQIAIDTLNWTIVGASAAIAAAALTVVLVGHTFIRQFLDWRSKNKRVKMLNSPCEVYFIVPSLSREHLDYYTQDEFQHSVNQIVLPSHSIRVVEIWIKPITPFRETEWYFGCEGELNNRPKPRRYINPYIIEGALGRGNPKDTPNHYIGSDHYYHIREERVRSPGDVYVGGFDLQTYESGEYEARLVFHGTERVGICRLSILVEDEPMTKMACVLHGDCFLEPVAADVAT